MKKIVKKIIIILIVIEIINTIVFAKSQEFIINDDAEFFNSKQNDINSYFDSNYQIENSGLNSEDNNELKNKIRDLTKKTTYLLLGAPNAKKESSEEYYKRHAEYLKLRYNPEVPKDSNNVLGLDVNSQEYKDDILSGITVPGMFLKLEELEIKYTSYGKIKVSIIDENNVIGQVTLEEITIKEQDEENPMEYKKVKTDLTMYYTFKKLGDEFKLLFLYGETNDNMKDSLEKSEEKIGVLSQNKDDNSKLEEIYDFSKAKAITENTLNKIYNDNKSKIVYLNSMYNTGVVASANGFFIEKDIIVTTYSYIEKTLMNAQRVTISDSNGKVYELDGIITVNTENDIAFLKVKEPNTSFVELKENNMQREDAVICINSKTGVGLAGSKGIVITNNKQLQISIPITEEAQGCPIFDINGNCMGIINSETVNSNMSYAIKSNILKQYYNKFSSIGFDNIKSIPFQELKEKYYIAYGEENTFNNVPNNKIKEFINIDNIEEVIGLTLVKGNYKDNIITLRFKNNVPKVMNSMIFATDFIESLKNNGYEEKTRSDSKVIYKKGKNQIIIMKEFDYLIIVMVKL